MNIEIWSDIACPFCYIGKRRLEEALAQFPHREHVEVVFRSFELDPGAARNISQDVHDMLAAKYGMTREKAQEMNRNMTVQGQTVGISFQFDTMKLTNTFDAHRIIHFAAAHGKMLQMSEALFKAYFTDSRHVGLHETLIGLAGEIGLDEQEAARVLASDDYTKEVRADEQEAARLGIRGVPYFVIQRKYAISGAQPTQVFLQALHKTWNEIHPEQ